MSSTWVDGIYGIDILAKSCKESRYFDALAQNLNYYLCEGSIFTWES